MSKLQPTQHELQISSITTVSPPGSGHNPESLPDLLLTCLQCLRGEGKKTLNETLGVNPAASVCYFILSEKEEEQVKQQAMNGGIGLCEENKQK